MAHITVSFCLQLLEYTCGSIADIYITAITVHKSLADGINKGQISIVPDKEKIKRGDWEWVTLLTDSESTANKKISGNLSWAVSPPTP